MTVRSVYQSKAPDTAYSEFAGKREQKVGLNAAGSYDVNSGYSPTSRWLPYAFQYSDFVSNVDAPGCSICRFPIARYTLVTRAAVRVDTAFDNASACDIGTGGTPDAPPGDGWGEDLNLESPGIFYDPNSDYNPGGSDGMQIYTSGDTIDILTDDNTPPTAGQGILFLEVISYNEVYNEEW